MAGDPLFILVVLAMATVAIILLIGIGGFGKGGSFNRKYANKLMRMRIMAQFVAVLIILLFVFGDSLLECKRFIQPQRRVDLYPGASQAEAATTKAATARSERRKDEREHS